tara:strand:+ start:8807 stop:8989 length:183 start_codon:yes stop_codon:yes gene_type:complete
MSKLLDPNYKPVCPLCSYKFRGCVCNRREADDGEIVHANCLAKYNYKLKLKENDKSKGKN